MLSSYDLNIDVTLNVEFNQRNPCEGRISNTHDPTKKEEVSIVQRLGSIVAEVANYDPFLFLNKSTILRKRYLLLYFHETRPRHNAGPQKIISIGIVYCKQIRFEERTGRDTLFSTGYNEAAD